MVLNWFIGNRIYGIIDLHLSYCLQQSNRDGITIFSITIEKIAGT